MRFKKRQPVKKYKFYLINNRTGEITWANRITSEQKGTYEKRYARYFHKLYEIPEDQNNYSGIYSYTPAQMTFDLVKYYKSQIRECLKIRKVYRNIIQSVGQLDNLKQLYHDNNEDNLLEYRMYLKIWEKKKADLIASPEYMLEILLR